jgi:hypothetical protein
MAAAVNVTSPKKPILTSAADLKFLKWTLRNRLGNFKSQSGTGIEGFVVPMTFRSSPKDDAARMGELRKVGATREEAEFSRSIEIPVPVSDLITGS